MNLSRSSKHGFSLVEVTVAIGITAFAGLAVVGLLPVGLSTFRQAKVEAAGAAIFKQVVSDVTQAGSGTFEGLKEGSVKALPVRFFDAQGREAEKWEAIYHAASGVAMRGGIATVVVDIAVNPVGDVSRDGATGGFDSAGRKQRRAAHVVSAL